MYRGTDILNAGQKVMQVRLRPETVGKLPIIDVEQSVVSALSPGATLAVTAPPGAGKSTYLPLAALFSIGGEGKIIVLEPRRTAALQVARRMADMIGEPVGLTVGYRMRLESRVCPQTRIEVVTEGVLIRMLVEDPSLEGVSAVFLDEFHERSLQADMALALTMECRRLLSPDLRIILMSATLDLDAVAGRLGARCVSSPGRMYPVDVVRSPYEADVRNVAEAAARTAVMAFRKEDGDLLTFLPGEADIRRAAELLREAVPDAEVVCLMGMMSAAEQSAVISRPAGCGRRIILSTPVAETSVTVQGVSAVIDSGLCRRMSYDPRTAMGTLQTVPISKDMALQRRGRAGRLGPGRCYTLYSAAAESRMAPSRTPEILEADLCRALLEIFCWGESDPYSLPWITPPPHGAVRDASELLSRLGATGPGGDVTPLGRRMCALGCHPRIARMLLGAESPEAKALACDIAAVLEERDPMALAGQGADISLRVTAMRRERSARRHGVWDRQMRSSARYMGLIGASPSGSAPDPFMCGALVALAYPERVALMADGVPGIFRTASSASLRTDDGDPLGSSQWLAVAASGGRTGDSGRVFLASPVDPSDLEPVSWERDAVFWDEASSRVVCRHERRVGMLLCGTSSIAVPDPEEIRRVVCAAVRDRGAALLDLQGDAADLRRRVDFAAARHPEIGFPDLSEQAFLNRCEEWLPLAAPDAASAQDLKHVDIPAAMLSLIDPDAVRQLDAIAPTHLSVPTGSRIRLEYRQGADAPVLRVRLQECFGLLDSPTVDYGRVPVLMELLSPGFRPVQLTSDLRSFWSGTYFQVRKELRRRYPKHSWPEDPLSATAVRGIQRKGK